MPSINYLAHLTPRPSRWQKNWNAYTRRRCSLTPARNSVIRPPTTYLNASPAHRRAVAELQATLLVAAARYPDDFWPWLVELSPEIDAFNSGFVLGEIKEELNGLGKCAGVLPNRYIGERIIPSRAPRPANRRDPRGTHPGAGELPDNVVPVADERHGRALARAQVVPQPQSNIGAIMAKSARKPLRRQLPSRAGSRPPNRRSRPPPRGNPRRQRSENAAAMRASTCPACKARCGLGSSG